MKHIKRQKNSQRRAVQNLLPPHLQVINTLPKRWLIRLDVNIYIITPPTTKQVTRRRWSEGKKKKRLTISQRGIQIIPIKYMYVVRGIYEIEIFQWNERNWRTRQRNKYEEFICSLERMDKQKDPFSTSGQKLWQLCIVFIRVWCETLYSPYSIHF